MRAHARAHARAPGRTRAHTRAHECVVTHARTHTRARTHAATDQHARTHAPHARTHTRSDRPARTHARTHTRARAGGRRQELRPGGRGRRDRAARPRRHPRAADVPIGTAACARRVCSTRLLHAVCRVSRIPPVAATSSYDLICPLNPKPLSLIPSTLTANPKILNPSANPNPPEPYPRRPT
jgi:hypothetical protein